MTVSVRNFVTKNTSLHFALVAGAIVSGGCAPQVFKPRAYIPPPVVAPPQYQQYQRPVRQAPVQSIPAFNKVAPVITSIQPVKVEPAVTTLPSLPSLPQIQVKEVTYKIKKGDSFWKIGRKYGLSMGEIAAYNNLPIKKHLRVGQVLILPPGAEFVPSGKRPVLKTDKMDDLQQILDARTENSPIRMARPDDGKHFVMKGDSLWKVAKRYNLKTSTLANANNLSSKAMLKIGQILIIPGKKSEMEAERQAEENTIKSIIGEQMSVPDNSLEESFEMAEEGILLNEDLSLDAIGNDTITEDLEIEKIDLDKGDDTESLFDDLILDGDDDMLADESIDSILGGDDDLSFDDQTEAISVSEDINLNAFAVRYGVKAEDIQKLNPSIPASGQLTKGMKVTIPLL